MYGVGFEVASMINLKLLENSCGNSKFNDRKEILNSVIEFIKSKNAILLCDREFFSFKFTHYLISLDIPFVIRIKQSLNCAKEITKNLNGLRKTIKNMFVGKYKGKKLYLDVSAKKIKGDYLIVVSYQVSNPVKTYRKRWKIECFFKCLKTAGFNVENTKITILKRLQTLFLLCGMAYVFCIKIGLWIHHNFEKMKFKKTLNCYQFSFFRYGLDWVTMMTIPPPNIPKITHFFNMLTNTVR
ncbi:MAG: transposase [Pseudomonadota bacterium]